MKHGADANQEQTVNVDEYGFSKQTDLLTQIFQIKTAIDVASENGNEEIVEILLKHGAKPELQLEQDQTALLDARGISALVSAIQKCNRKIVTMLLNANAHVNFLDIRRSKTPLDVAAEIGDGETIKELLKRDAKIERYCTEYSGKVLGRAVFWKEHTSSSLAAAIRAHQRREILSLIEAGADVNWIEKSSRPNKTKNPSLRMIALEHGDVATADALKNKGAMAREDDEVNSMLILAVKQRHLDDIQDLLERGADCNYISETGTPLECAVAVGDEDIVQLLLENQSKIETERSNGDEHSSLITAVKHNRLSIINTLLKARANVNFTERVSVYVPFIEEEVQEERQKHEQFHKNSQYTRHSLLEEESCALSVAISNGNRIAIDTLLTSEVNVNWTGSLGSLLEYAVKLDDEITVGELLKKGAEKESGSHSALIAAIQGNNIGLVDRLLESGADVNYVVDNKSALQYAVESGNLAIVSKLVEKGAKLEMTTQKIIASALISAVKMRDKAIMYQLIQWGADVHVTEVDSTGSMTSLLWAVRMSDQHAIRILLNNSAKADREKYPKKVERKQQESALIAAVAVSTHSIVKTLLYSGVDVNCSDWKSQTPLSCANLSSNNEIVKELLIRGATVERRDHNDNNSISELVVAIKRRRKSVIATLLEFEADVNCVTEGQSPLTAAVEMEDHETFKALLDRKAKMVSMVDGKGVDSSLIAAIKLQRKGMIATLLKSGANVNFVVDGQSPLSHALKVDDLETMQELVKRGAKMEPKIGEQEWETIVTDDIDTKRMVVTSPDCSYHLTNSTLSTTHFCWFHWLGRIINKLTASKKMSFLVRTSSCVATENKRVSTAESVYGSKDNPSKDIELVTDWNLTVYCCDVCKEVQKRLDREIGVSKRF
jgi:ankyrin repeat protein